MTDKEQIMINGVDVSGCEYLTYELEEDGEYYWFCKISPTGGPDECEYNPECFYKRVLKQLARKTQEYEDLKERLERTEEDLKYQCVDCMNVKSDRYRKALEEIEEYIKKYECDNCEDYVFGCGDCGTPRDILDIINKAKGENPDEN